ncbi:MAG: 50S ribosomal protein L23 [Minisyncoccales bacterium]
MAIFNIFKKKIRKKEEKKEIKKEQAQKLTAEQTTLAGQPKIKKETDFAEGYKIIKSPHITEKASDLTETNQYVFKVFSQANKIQIKKAVEKKYGVNVEKIRIINVPSKRRRMGRIVGARQGYKKAIVEIKKGQKIEILPR